MSASIPRAKSAARPADPDASRAHEVKLPFRPDSFKVSDLRRAIKQLRDAEKATRIAAE